VGIDFLNRFLGKDFWKDKVQSSQGVGTTYAHILVDAVKVADDWRMVPFLTEWALDGVVLSNDQPEAYYSDSSNKRDGQLFNIGIQGVCAVNNGFVDEKGMGQLARDAGRLFAPGYMDHRTQSYGDDKTQNNQSFDFAASYQGPQYHLYPLQMFDRQIRPMQELFVGLVATVIEVPYKNVLDTYDSAYNAHKIVMRDANKAKNQREQLIQTRDRSTSSPTEKANAETRLANLEIRLAALLNQIAEFEKAHSAAKKMLKDRDTFRQMEWWDNDNNTPKVGEGVPTKHFHTFKFITFSSGQLFDLDNTIDVMAPEGEPKMSKRRRVDSDPYESEAKIEDLQRLVGAWHVGKVLDMKAAKMPYFEGGPVETGYRVSVNLNIEWWDWRRLRKAFTNSSTGLQVAGLLKGPGMAKFDEEKESIIEEHERILQWPTAFDSNIYNVPGFLSATDVDPDDVREFVEKNTSIPIDPGAFYRGNEIDRGTQNENYMREYFPRKAVNWGAIYKGKGTELPSQEPDNPEDVPPAIFEARAAKLPQLPPAPPLLADSDSITDDHMNQLHAHFERAVQNLKAMLAPVTPGEMGAFGGVRVTTQKKPEAAIEAVAKTSPSAPVSLPPMANVTEVAYTPAPETESSSTLEGAVTATVTSSATPPSTSVAAIVAEDPPSSPGPEELIDASAASPAPVESPVPAATTDAPSPVGRSGTRRRGGAGASVASDVFSSIFGEDASSAPMQPLNPAHQAGSSSGTSGRSYRRRGSGGS
jgi:hypothetical protein